MRSMQRAVLDAIYPLNLIIFHMVVVVEVLGMVVVAMGRFSCSGVKRLEVVVVQGELVVLGVLGVLAYLAYRDLLAYLVDP